MQSSQPTKIDTSLVVIHDAPQECPYLEGRIARMPLEYPRHQLTPTDLDRLLENGYRRTGSMLYRTRCPDCQQCIPTRVEAEKFAPTKSMRRILNRAERELEIRWGRPRADADRLRLFNAHRAQRSLSRRGDANLSDYREFLVASCVETAELSFRQNNQLIGIAIIDIGNVSVNAVYTHFAPEASRFSIGTLAILKQIQWAQMTRRKYVYLGLFVADNPHLNYKNRFTPQQQLLGGIWREPDAK